MKKVEFTIMGEPVAKGRPRFNSYTHRAITPVKTANYENLVKLSYPSGERLNGAISATIQAYFPIPKSESKKNRALMLAGEIRHTKKCDCDNLAKIILDALNTIAYDDDKQVCDLRVRKWYSDEPRVEVTLEEVLP